MHSINIQCLLHLLVGHSLFESLISQIGLFISQNSNLTYLLLTTVLPLNTIH